MTPRGFASPVPPPLLSVAVPLFLPFLFSFLSSVLTLSSVPPLPPLFLLRFLSSLWAPNEDFPPRRHLCISVLKDERLKLLLSAEESFDDFV